jgi:transcriptional regulator with XRE-family HTH domain
MKSKELKKLRKLLGLSQLELSKCSGVSRYKISLYENSYQKLSKTEMDKLMNILRKQQSVVQKTFCKRGGE